MKSLDQQIFRMMKLFFTTLQMCICHHTFIQKYLRHTTKYESQSKLQNLGETDVPTETHPSYLTIEAQVEKWTECECVHQREERILSHPLILAVNPKLL